VDHVHNEEIRSGGYLNLYADANGRAIDLVAFVPVNIARRSIFPSSYGFKLGIEKLANGSASVGVRFLLDEQLESRNDRFYFFDEGRKSEPV